MKSSLKLILVLLFVAGSIIGCDGCFDDAVTNKVDAPNFTFVKGTNYTVKLSSSTRDAKVVYTLDGTDPKTSETAVEGNEVEIDFYTTIKAYAYKEGKRESITLTFGLPGISASRKVRYNTDDTVYDHIYFANDPNDKPKVIKYFNGKGDDGQWFTGDDALSYYILYTYEGDVLSKEYKYTGVGEDGKWLTPDDTFEYVSSYTVNENGEITKETLEGASGNAIAEATYEHEKDANGWVTKTTIDGTSGTYPAKDINIYEGGYGSVVANVNYTGSCEKTGDFTYTYTDGEKVKLVTPDRTWDYPTDENKEYTYEFEYDAKGNASKKVKKLGYGTDTNWGYTEQTFDESNNLLTSTLYWDNAGENSRAHYEYEYANNLLSKVTKYKTLAKEKMRYWKEFQYGTGDKLSVVNYYNKDEEKEKFDEYTWDTESYYLTKQRPDVASHSVQVALSASFKTLTGGTITISGREYSHTGDPVSEIVDDTDDLDKLAKNTAEKIKYIVDNTDFGENSLTIHGKEEGDCQILISTYGNSVNVVFDFNEYNDGDVIVDGILDFEMSGTIDVSGQLVSDGAGYIDGDLYVADANPDFSDADYITVAITKIVTDAEDRIIQEVEYKTAGADGDWTAMADNKVKYVRKYKYTDGKLEREAQFKGTGKGDSEWDYTNEILASNDKVDYRIEYTYKTSGELETETVYRDYGIYGTTASTDAPVSTLKYYLGWRLWWDVAQRFEIDWDDDYWHEDEDDEDRLEWSVE